MPSDPEILDILIDRVDQRRDTVGIVVGVIDPLGRRIIAHGSFGKGDPRPLGGDTLFEIGAVTQLFTALLLTDMVRRGELAMADPVATYLPSDVVVPQRSGRQITLQHLATHMSGLPRMPPDFAPGSPSNPYAGFSVADLYRSLSRCQLPREIDSQFEYSNLGFGLLGHALERRAGRDFETLARERIFDVLGLANTCIALSPEQRTRFAQGHNASLDPVPSWDIPTLAGAGALRSTANDLLTFLGAALGYIDTPLAPAMAALLAVRRPTGPVARLTTALGWQVLGERSETFWKDGATGGYASFAGCDPRTHVGVVVLSNACSTSGALTGVSDIGLHLLNPCVPLNRPHQEREAVAVDACVLDSFVGRYRLRPNFVIDVTREETRVFAQASGQARLEIFPESEREFFSVKGDVQIAFELDAQGRATLLLLRQGGTPFPPAPRVE